MHTNSNRLAMTKQATAITLGALLWVAQCLFVVHEFEHLTAQDEQEICELCVAATGLDQPVAFVHQGAVSFDAHFLPNLYHSNIQLEAYFTVQARGPPGDLIG